MTIDLSRRKHVANVLHNHGVRLTKAMGQHLLVDRTALEEILGAAALTGEDEVLEVGPGAGVLTAELAQRAKRVVAVELDARLVGVLRETVQSPNVEIVEGDALAVDPAQLFGGRPYKHVANLPYGVATPLLRKLLYATPEHRPSLLVVMVQLEVARRMAARPNDMNVLAVQVQLVADVELLFELPPDAFFPPPAVSSAVVRLRPLPERRVPLLPTEQRFFQTVMAGFSQKRKQLHNSLGSLGVGVDRIQQALESACIVSSRRAETLSLEDWSRLSAALWIDASDTAQTASNVEDSVPPAGR